MAIAAISTIVEWYDFTLYLYLATLLSRVFYGGGNGSLVAVFGGFALSYLMRPLGAAILGHVGDRHGRRRMMLLSMGAMTLAMLGVALLPTYAQIGPAAGWLLLLLRCVMAFSVGGEYTGVVAYLLEGAPGSRRGLITSSAAAASEVGGLLAAGVSTLTIEAFDPADLDRWAWRIPFLVGAGLAASIWFARSAMHESPEFLRQQSEGRVPLRPLRDTIVRRPAGLGRAFAISALGSITYYVGITYVPAFLASAGAINEGDALALSTLAALAVILVTPVVGAASDRWGRKPLLLLLCGAGAVLPMPLFQLMTFGYRPALAGALALALLGGGVSAVGAVATAEQFEGEGRLSGLALGATGATALFGGLTPLLGQLLITRTGLAIAPGAMIAAVALCVFPVLLRLPESTRHGR